jgi:hypothetical protein
MTSSPVLARRHLTRSLGLAALAATAAGITGCANNQHPQPTALPPAPTSPSASESLHQFPVLIPSHWTG